MPDPIYKNEGQETLHIVSTGRRKQRSLLQALLDKGGWNKSTNNPTTSG
jgi:hypothetical protein